MNKTILIPDQTSYICTMNVDEHILWKLTMEKYLDN